MVGDIAGILNLVMARDTDVAWSPEIKMLALVVYGEVRHRNVPLRGWQRADLSNGEEAMMAERRETPFAVEAMGSRWERPERESRPVFGDPGGTVVASVPRSLVFDWLIAA
jgi:hypothetical protein